MFVARDTELQILEELYRTGTFQLIPVWGRRRVGKTRLLNEFVSGKPRVYFFTAGETTARENLERLSSSILAWYDPLGADVGYATNAPIFPSFDAAFARVFEEAREERTVLVIDEYPYLAKSYPGVSSLLQRLVDAYKDTSKLMLILCGSSMTFMEHQVLGEKSPLYGRRTAQLKLETFDYLDASRLLATKDPIRAVELYSLVGGVPLYLEQLEAAHSTEWNIANRMLGQGRFLYAEPKSFLLQEVSSPAPYAAVIDAVSSGRSRPNEIADATGIQGPNVNEYLKRLSELGVVRRDTPVGRANKKQVTYRIADNLFRFWHSFVPRYEQAIDFGQTDAVAKRICHNDLATFVGHSFEDVCRQWVIRRMAEGSIDVLPSRVGSWWGTDVISHEQADVDVVAAGSDGELVCGECKWTNDAVDARVVETLERRALSVMDQPSSAHFFVFSKSGFADSARREAKRAGNVRLVWIDELFE